MNNSKPGGGRPPPKQSTELKSNLSSDETIENKFEKAFQQKPGPSRLIRISGDELIKTFTVQIPDSDEEDENEIGGSVSKKLPQCPGHLNVSMGRESREDDLHGRIPRQSRKISIYERAGLRGLVNIGNTCFMNSILQCLSNTGPLLRYILHDKFVPEVNTNAPLNGALLAAFVKLIKQIWGPGEHPVDTTNLKSKLQIIAPRFRGSHQHDSQELLRYLLDGLHEELNRIKVKPPYVTFEAKEEWNLAQHSLMAWKNYIRTDSSQIVDIFVGQLKSTLTCSACSNVSVTFDPFWDLSISIPGYGPEVTLEKCLENFTKTETLDGDEKAYCAKCKSHQKSTKRFTIERFPEVLVIHLKRFKGEEKLRTVVRFPLLGLDIGPYSSSRTNCCSYNLYGISNHSGNVTSGHYIGYCKHPFNNCWAIYDDTNVRSVTSQVVKETEAYVLFYEMSEGSKSVLF